MMEIRKISDHQAFDEYVAKHPYGHYMKTSRWGEFKKETEKDDYECIGFYEGDTLKGTTMVLKGKWLGHSYDYIPWGPCIDYENKEERNEVFDLLKKYADDDGVQFLRVDPNVERVPHDIKGNVLEGFNHEDVTEDLKKDGYIHKGYGYAYNGSWNNRFTLIVDLTVGKEAVFKRFNPQRRRAINRHKTWHVSTHLGSKNDIPSLMALEKQLTEQDGFKPHSYRFFESIADHFGDHCRIYVTDIDLDGMIASMTAELGTKKYRKDPEAREAAKKNIVRAKELKLKYGPKVTIACGLFIYWGKQSWDLYTYNHKAFNFIQPVDNLHYFAMCDMIDHGVEKYDMVGFSGVTTKDDPYYGLYNYKSSFGPDYIERIGEFDYVRNPNAMKRFRFEKLAVNHVKRKWWTFRYQNKKEIDEIKDAKN